MRDEETLDTRVIRLEVKVDEIGKTTQRIFDAVYGNGKPGLLADLQDIRSQLEAATAHKADWKWVISTIIAIAALVAAFKGVVQ